MVRNVRIYSSSFVEFYRSKEPKVQQKIEFVIDLIRYERAGPAKFFKRLRDTEGLYEVRVITPHKSIRKLCFLDEGNSVVLTNGFIKKTQKTPKKQIATAQRLRDEYYFDK